MTTTSEQKPASKVLSVTHDADGMKTKVVKTREGHIITSRERGTTVFPNEYEWNHQEIRWVYDEDEPIEVASGPPYSVVVNVPLTARVLLSIADTMKECAESWERWEAEAAARKATSAPTMTFEEWFAEEEEG